MSVRPPQVFRRQAADNPVAAALEQEVFAEKAGTLARLNKKLDQALRNIPADEGEYSLDAADRDTQDKTQGHPKADERRRLRALRIAEAAEALWHVTIQRELCGLREHKAFFDHMGVPARVRLSAGPVPAHLKRKP